MGIVISFWTEKSFWFVVYNIVMDSYLDSLKKKG